MTTPINKTTPSAREILDKHHKSFVKEIGLASIHTENFPEAYKQQALRAIKEAAQLSWEAGYKRGRQHNKTPITAPDKETFITNLMRE